jgi:hypothetical protein
LLHELEQPLQIEQEQRLHVHKQSLQTRSSHCSQVEYSSSVIESPQPAQERLPFQSASET